MHVICACFVNNLSVCIRSVKVAAHELHGTHFSYFGSSQNFTKQTVNAAQRLEFIYKSI